MRGRSPSVQRFFMNNLMWTVKREVKENTGTATSASLRSPCVSVCVSVCLSVCVSVCLLFCGGCAPVYVLCLGSNSCLCICVYVVVCDCEYVCWCVALAVCSNLSVPGIRNLFSNAYQIPVEHFLWFMSYQWLIIFCEI